MTVYAYIVCEGKDSIIDQLEKLYAFGYNGKIVINPGVINMEKIQDSLTPRDTFVTTSVMLLGINMQGLYQFLSQLLLEEKSFCFINEGIDSQTERGMQFMNDLEIFCQMDGYTNQGSQSHIRQPGRPKISLEQERQILNMYENSNHSIREIARFVGVSVGTVHKYVKNAYLNMTIDKRIESSKAVH